MSDSSSILVFLNYVKINFETFSFSTFLKQNPKWTALAVLNAPTLFAEIKRFCFYVKATVTSNYDDKRMRVEIGRENLQLR